MSLTEYVINHTDRNACKCGKCIYSGENKDLGKHTVDMYFFDVCLKNNPDKEEFIRLINSHQGEFCDLKPLETECNYISLGAWIGDQGVALQFMALGNLLGLWGVLTPKHFLPDTPINKPLMDRMAGSGLVTTVPHKS